VEVVVVPETTHEIVHIRPRLDVLYNRLTPEASHEDDCALVPLGQEDAG
jgi:hypothetical protein